jgi:hypothetical protein
MELLVVLIIWCLYCHFFVKPYEARKKMEVKKKKSARKGIVLRMFFLEKSLITKSCVTMAANFMSKGKSKSLFKCSSVWNVRRGFSCYNRKKSLPLRVGNQSYGYSTP